MNRKVLSLVQLRERCGFWQPRLGVADWAFTIQLAHAHEFSDQRVTANCTFNLETRRAAIKILHASEHLDDALAPLDMEVSLVHEMLHPLFGPFDLTKSNSLEDTMLEQAITCLSTALVELSRM